MRHPVGTGTLRRACRSVVVALSLGILGVTQSNAAADELATALDAFRAHYAERFDGASFVRGTVEGCGDVLHLDTSALRRPATGPMVLDHGARQRDAVVLIHGLSDSPFFLCALARSLYEAGANVVLPLLSGQGRAEPWPEVHDPATTQRWQADAMAALDFARQRGDRVSVGGLSTGGVLSTWLWTQRPEAVNGGILLFSAAFDFATPLKLAAGCAGTEAERARSRLRRWCYGLLADRVKAAEVDGPWTTANPYRTTFSYFQALHLGLLRRETLQALAQRPLTAPLFVAHSVADETAPIAGIEALVAAHLRPERITRFTIDDVRRANCRELASDCTTPAPAAAACGVQQASLVLAEPITAVGGAVCEPANPLFGDMAAAAAAFVAGLPGEGGP